MTTKTNYILTFIFINFWLMMISCATRERCARFFPQTQNSDSVRIRNDTVELIRDSIYTIPPDSAWLMALLECDSTGNVLLKQITDLQLGHRIKPGITLTNNKLTVNCKVDSMAVYLSWKERHIKTSRDSKVSKTYVVQWNYLTNSQVFQMYCGRAFLALLGCAALYMLYRFRKKLLHA